MLSDAERNVLNIGLQKYRAGQAEPILIGGENPAQTRIEFDDFLSPGDRGG
jgi:hypothetical protein